MSQSCIETPEAPAWLSKLESQREKLSKGKLGHDSGAGAPCNVCGPSCPGLDLHFWRKVCRGCHCPKDVHDVQDDDLSGWAQFELLGTARPKNITVMKIRGIADEPVKLDWVPPNTSPDMVSDYMTCLGDALAPVMGSGGAARRREQLRRQVPPHDISSDLCCHSLTKQEQDTHQEYISNIKNRVVGLGNIVRIGNIQRGDVITIGTEDSRPVAGVKSMSLPLKLSNLGKGINYNQVPNNVSDKVLVLDNMGNVINKSPYIPDYKTSPILSRIVKDKLNFMRIESDRIKSAVEHGPIYDRMFKDLKQLNVPIENDVYLTPIKSFRDEYNLNPKFKEETTAFAEAEGAKVMSSSSNALNNNDNISSQQIISNEHPQMGTIFGPNGEIWSWSSSTKEDVNNPISAINATNIHQSYISSTDNVPQANKQFSTKIPRHNVMNDDFSEIPPIPNYNTYPGDTPAGKVPLGINQNTSLKSNIHHPGDAIIPQAKYPVGAANNAGTKTGHPSEQTSTDHNIGSVLQGVGDLKISPSDGSDDTECDMHCRRCSLPFVPGQVAVKAERAGQDAFWHPQCFTCTKCSQLLADLVYFYYKDDIYCARDLAEALEIPRCAACDELIFSRSYTAAEGSFFHTTHFCCYHCDAPLGGQQYVPDEKSRQPMCLQCYDKFHAEKCHTCKQVIRPDQQGVSWSTFHWHGECFNCAGKQCGKSLLSGRFVVKHEMPFCSQVCIQNTIN